MKDGGNDSGRAAERVAKASAKGSKGSREARLKLALRENLKRRKSQARERSDFTPESPGSDDMARDRAEKNPDK